jgi:hypothetical protein
VKWLLLAFGTLMLPVQAFGQQDGPPLNAKFHEDFRRGDPKNAAIRPIRDGNFVWESGGARVLIPAGQGKIPTTGVAANFKIKGDFEITASYEILKAEIPTEGYGVGAILYVAIDPDAMHAVSLSRRHMPKGNQIFMADRMIPKDGKPDHHIRERPAKSEKGKLRIKRTGAMVSFYFAEGDGADFLPIYQDAKAKKTDVEFGAGEIRYFQIGGDAGDSEAALDLRLLDLTVHAEALPGYEAAPTKGEAPSPARPPGSPPPPPVGSTGSTNWTLIGGGIGAIVLVAALGVGGFFFLRGRKKSSESVKSTKAPNKKPAPDMPQLAIALRCACGKKFKVKSMLAGKKIKCPECGKSLNVPQQKAQPS